MAAKSDKKPAARARRSKTEVQREFEELQAVAESEEVDAKTAAAIKARQDEIRAEVAEVGVESVVQRIAGLGIDVSRALADVSEKLTAKVRLLSTLREAAAIERREIERLHRIDVAATAVDQLIEDYAARQSALETELVAKQAEAEERAERAERERREQEEALKKQRQREIEDYEYRKTLERKKAQDKYDEETRTLARQNAEKQEALERDWQRREAALKEREELLARLQAEVAAFPARLAKETGAAAVGARKQAEGQLERQMLLQKKDAEAEARVAQLQVKALEQQLLAGAAQIAALEKQLAEAKQQVQDVAVRAIEGASGARALSHINQIAMEQAKNRPQG
jgi:hypothetical protein